jgi:phage terminase small subunit
MKPPKHEPRRCTGKNKKGGPCGRPPILGGFVCPKHGGGLPRVKAKAAERLADLIDPDRALRTAAALAYSDVTEIYDDQFKLKPLRDWPLSLRQAIKRIEPRLANVDPGDGAADRVLRLELHDKVKPLEMLMKHLGLLEEKVAHTGGIEITWRSSE